MTNMTGGNADCVACEQELIRNGEQSSWMRSFMVCSWCGNKRCPKASWHGYPCTASNEPGQEGSIYGPVLTPEERAAKLEEYKKEIEKLL